MPCCVPRRAWGSLRSLLQRPLSCISTTYFQTCTSEDGIVFERERWWQATPALAWHEAYASCPFQHARLCGVQASFAPGEAEGHPSLTPPEVLRA